MSERIITLISHPGARAWAGYSVYLMPLTNSGGNAGSTWMSASRSLYCIVCPPRI